MAKLRHIDIGTSLTKAEWEADTTHAVGDIAFESDANTIAWSDIILSRIAANILGLAAGDSFRITDDTAFISEATTTPPGPIGTAPGTVAAASTSSKFSIGRLSRGGDNVTSLNIVYFDSAVAERVTHQFDGNGIFGSVTPLDQQIFFEGFVINDAQPKVRLKGNPTVGDTSEIQFGRGGVNAPDVSLGRAQGASPILYTVIGGTLITEVQADGLWLASGKKFYVAGTEVVGARVIDARADDVVDNTYGAEEAGVLDALRDAMIAHGLIAAA